MTESAEKSSSRLPQYDAWTYMTKLPGVGLTLRGHSRSAEMTCFWIPELSLMLDAGVPSQYQPDYIFMTHGHGDHSFQLPMVLGGTSKRVLVYVPPGTTRFYDNFTQSFFQLNAQSDNVGEYEGDVYEGYKIIEAQPGHSFELVHKKETYKIRVIECFHMIGCIGFGITKVCRRLDPKYKGLPGKDIAQLKKDGIDVMETYDKHLLVYLGDTTIRVFEDEVIFRYKYIMVESTFIYKEDEERAENNTHICFTKLEPVIQEHPENIFVLIHFSLRYTVEEIRSVVDGKYDNVIVWTN